MISASDRCASVSAKQTKRHFSCQPDDENNRKLRNHQLGVLKDQYSIQTQAVSGYIKCDEEYA
jgi:hypothetical protein